MANPKYPNVRVQLSGEDGNAYAIIGMVAQALRRQVGNEAADEYREQALASESYDGLLQLTMQTVEVL